MTLSAVVETILWPLCSGIISWLVAHYVANKRINDARLWDLIQRAESQVDIIDLKACAYWEAGHCPSASQYSRELQVMLRDLASMINKVKNLCPKQKEALLNRMTAFRKSVTLDFENTKRSKLPSNAPKLKDISEEATALRELLSDLAP
ncbi:MAG: hypothetical protein GC134_04155 [Proteobacteria bacterium]|nr:hypothetical protein [Pseudomonadota bacterium]